MALVAVIDYGMGNLRSVENALSVVGVESVTLTAPIADSGLTHVVLPGVGAFGDAMARLHDGGWVPWLHQRAADTTPILGICLGMQLLADVSAEHGRHKGLGLIPGSVTGLSAGDDFRIPHIGWNDVEPVTDHPVLPQHQGSQLFYFVHSFVFVPDDPGHVAGRCNHGSDFAAVVASGSVIGVQFHPEKSQAEGLALLGRFTQWSPC